MIGKPSGPTGCRGRSVAVKATKKKGGWSSQGSSHNRSGCSCPRVEGHRCRHVCVMLALVDHGDGLLKIVRRERVIVQASMKGRAESCCPTKLHHKKLARCRRRSTRGRRQARLLPPQAEGKEGPGEVAGCGARLEALDLNHASWQSTASQLSQNGSSRTTSSRLQVDPVKLTREKPRSERCEQSLHLGGARMSKLHLV